MRQGLAQPAPRVLPASLGRQVRPALAARALLEQPGSAPLGLLVSALKARLGRRESPVELVLRAPLELLALPGQQVLQASSG